MSDPFEERLAAGGHVLPQPRQPSGNYVPCRRSGNLVYISGHGPRSAAGDLITGQVGTEIDLETARQGAGYAVLNCIAALRQEIGNLEKVTGIVSIFGMVNAAPGFGDHPRVIDGASDLVVELFGDKGRHSRSAVGMGSLPVNMCVEIEMVVEISDSDG